jgi:hypothetical protein
VDDEGMAIEKKKKKKKKDKGKIKTQASRMKKVWQ